MWDNVGRVRVNFGRILVEIGPTFTDFGPMLSEFRPSLADSGPCWSILVEIGPCVRPNASNCWSVSAQLESGLFWPTLAKLGRYYRSRAVHFGPRLNDSGPILAKVGRNRATFGRPRTEFGRNRSNSADVGPNFAVSGKCRESWSVDLGKLRPNAN